MYDTKFWTSEAVKYLRIPQLLLAGAPLTPVLGQGELYGAKESFSVQVNFLSLFPAPFLAPFPPLHMQLSPKVHAVRGIPWSRIATKCKQIEMPRKQKWSRFVAVEKVDHKNKAKKKSWQHAWNPPFLLLTHFSHVLLIHNLTEGFPTALTFKQTLLQHMSCHVLGHVEFTFAGTCCFQLLHINDSCT